jgi:predicted nucleotidyltransferase
MAADIALARECKRRVVDAFHERVAKVVLFGSRARGDSCPNSDWDIAVFLEDDPTLDDRYRLTGLGTDLLVDTARSSSRLLCRCGVRAIGTDGIDS